MPRKLPNLPGWSDSPPEWVTGAVKKYNESVKGDPQGVHLFITPQRDEYDHPYFSVNWTRDSSHGRTVARGGNFYRMYYAEESDTLAVSANGTSSMLVFANSVNVEEKDNRLQSTFVSREQHLDDFFAQPYEVFRRSDERFTDAGWRMNRWQMHETMLTSMARATIMPDTVYNEEDRTRPLSADERQNLNDISAQALGQAMGLRKNRALRIKNYALGGIGDTPFGIGNWKDLRREQREASFAFNERFEPEEMFTSPGRIEDQSRVQGSLKTFLFVDNPLAFSEGGMLTRPGSGYTGVQVDFRIPDSDTLARDDVERIGWKPNTLYGSKQPTNMPAGFTFVESRNIGDSYSLNNNQYALVQSVNENQRGFNASIMLFNDRSTAENKASAGMKYVNQPVSDTNALFAEAEERLPGYSISGIGAPPSKDSRRLQVAVRNFFSQTAADQLGDFLSVAQRGMSRTEALNRVQVTAAGKRVFPASGIPENAQLSFQNDFETHFIIHQAAQERLRKQTFEMNVPYVQSTDTMRLLQQQMGSERFHEEYHGPELGTDAKGEPVYEPLDLSGSTVSFNRTENVTYAHELGWELPKNTTGVSNIGGHRLNLLGRWQRPAFEDLTGRDQRGEFSNPALRLSRAAMHNRGVLNVDPFNIENLDYEYARQQAIESTGGELGPHIPALIDQISQQSQGRYLQIGNAVFPPAKDLAMMVRSRGDKDGLGQKVYDMFDSLYEDAEIDGSLVDSARKQILEAETYSQTARKARSIRVPALTGATTGISTLPINTAVANEDDVLDLIGKMRVSKKAKARLIKSWQEEGELEGLFYAQESREEMSSYGVTIYSMRRAEELFPGTSQYTIAPGRVGIGNLTGGQLDKDYDGDPNSLTLSSSRVGTLKRSSPGTLFSGAANEIEAYLKKAANAGSMVKWLTSALGTKNYTLLSTLRNQSKQANISDEQMQTTFSPFIEALGSFAAHLGYSQEANADLALLGNRPYQLAMDQSPSDSPNTHWIQRFIREFNIANPETGGVSVFKGDPSRSGPYAGVLRNDSAKLALNMFQGAIGFESTATDSEYLGDGKNPGIVSGLARALAGKSDVDNPEKLNLIREALAKVRAGGSGIEVLAAITGKTYSDTDAARFAEAVQSHNLVGYGKGAAPRYRAGQDPMLDDIRNWAFGTQDEDQRSFMGHYLTAWGASNTLMGFHQQPSMEGIDLETPARAMQAIRTEISFRRGTNEVTKAADTIYNSQASSAGSKYLAERLQAKEPAPRKVWARPITDMIPGRKDHQQHLAALVHQAGYDDPELAKLLPPLEEMSSGGYTGEGLKDDPAGVVHAGEYVLTQSDVAAIRSGETLQVMRKVERDLAQMPGYSEGGLVGYRNGGAVHEYEPWDNEDYYQQHISQAFEQHLPGIIQGDARQNLIDWQTTVGAAIGRTQGAVNSRMYHWGLLGDDTWSGHLVNQNRAPLPTNAAASPPQNLVVNAVPVSSQQASAPSSTLPPVLQALLNASQSLNTPLPVSQSSPPAVPSYSPPVVPPQAPVATTPPSNLQPPVITPVVLPPVAANQLPPALATLAAANAQMAAQPVGTVPGSLMPQIANQNSATGATVPGGTSYPPVPVRGGRGGRKDYVIGEMGPSIIQEGDGTPDEDEAFLRRFVTRLNSGRGEGAGDALKTPGISNALSRSINIVDQYAGLDEASRANMSEDDVEAVRRHAGYLRMTEAHVNAMGKAQRGREVPTDVEDRLTDVGAVMQQYETMGGKVTLPEQTVEARRKAMADVHADHSGDSGAFIRTTGLSAFADKLREVDDVIGRVNQKQETYIGQAKNLIHIYDDSVSTLNSADTALRKAQAAGGGVGDLDEGHQSVLRAATPEVRDLLDAHAPQVGALRDAVFKAQTELGLNPFADEEFRQETLARTMLRPGRMGAIKRQELPDEAYEGGLDTAFGTIRGKEQIEAVSGAARFANRATQAFWAVSHANNWLIQPMAAEAAQYQQYASAQGQSLGYGGGSSYQEMMAGGYGDLARRQSNTEAFNRTVGRQVFNTYSGLIGTESRSLGQTVGFATAVGGPAIAAAIAGTEMTGDPYVGAIAGGAVGTLAAGAYFVNSVQDTQQNADTYRDLQTARQNVGNRLGISPDSIGARVVGGLGTFFRNPVGSVSLGVGAIFDGQRIGRQATLDTLTSNWLSASTGTSLSAGDLGGNYSEYETQNSLLNSFIKQRGYRGISPEAALGTYRYGQTYLSGNLSSPLLDTMDQWAQMGYGNPADIFGTIAAGTNVTGSDFAGQVASAEGVSAYVNSLPQNQRAGALVKLQAQASSFSALNYARASSGQEMVPAEKWNSFYPTDPVRSSIYSQGEQQQAQAMIFNPVFAQQLGDYSGDIQSLLNFGGTAGLMQAQVMQGNFGVANQLSTSLQAGSNLSGGRQAAMVQQRLRMGEVAGYQVDQAAGGNAYYATLLNGNNPNYNLMDLQTGSNPFQYGVNGMEYGQLQAAAQKYGMTDTLMTPGEVAGGVAGLQRQAFEIERTSARTQYQFSTNMRSMETAMDMGGGTIGAGGFMQGGNLDALKQLLSQYNIPLNTGNGMTAFQTQDAQTMLQRRQQDWSMNMQGQQLQLNQQQFGLAGTQFYENFGLQQRQFQYNTGYQRNEMGIQQQHTLTQFGWQQEDLSFGRSVMDVQFGWQQEDFARNTRYARGREKRDLMREQQRSTVMYAMQAGHEDVQENRLSTQKQWEEDEFKRKKDYFDQSVKFQQEQMDLEKKHFEQGRALEQQRMTLAQQDHVKQLGWLVESRTYEDQQRLIERQWFAAQQNLNQQMSDTMFALGERSRTVNANLGLMNDAMQITNERYALLVQNGGAYNDMLLRQNQIITGTTPPTSGGHTTPGGGHVQTAGRDFVTQSTPHLAITIEAMVESQKQTNALLSEIRDNPTQFTAVINNKPSAVDQVSTRDRLRALV